MEIGVIGAGKVGKALVRGLLDAGYDVGGIACGSAGSTGKAAAELGVPGMTPAQVLERCSTVFLSVPDRSIRPVAEELAAGLGTGRKRLDAGIGPDIMVAEATGLTVDGRDDAVPPEDVKTVFHCSGAAGTTELEALAAAGCRCGSFHPLQSFAGGPASWQGVYVALDGGPAAVETGEALARALGSVPFTVPAEDRALYHAAACVCSNYTVTLMTLAQKLMSRWTGSGPAGLRALLPLLKGTVANLERAGEAASALTGPIARGDGTTVEKHLAVLPPEFMALYRGLGLETVAIAPELDDVQRKRLALLLEGAECLPLRKVQ